MTEWATARVRPYKTTTKLFTIVRAKNLSPLPIIQRLSIYNTKTYAFKKLLLNTDKGIKSLAESDKGFKPLAEKIIPLYGRGQGEAPVIHSPAYPRTDGIRRAGRHRKRTACMHYFRTIQSGNGKHNGEVYPIE
jgi:hypothetical protein